MEFQDVIRTRRSVREFSDREVSDNVLRDILNAARIAPSGSNRQPWKFIVIRDPARKHRMVEICEDQAFIAEAPVVIVACGRDIKFNRGGYMGAMSMLVDVSIAFDHLILAAREKGLGTCWIGSFDNAEAKEFLKVPKDYEVVAITPLGYPASDTAFHPETTRKELLEIVSLEQF